ncbi:MAG TPA: VOC family protein [Steroidobacteraceae bacterium]|nr:VOC family protein [Steroidobacteraceae bacterium]
MRLRQIALVAHDLAAARAEITAVLGIDYAYDDPGVGKYGLKNAVFPVGTTFLEVVSPHAPGTTAARLLEKRGGAGGYMVILQVDDLAEARARVREAGARIVDQTDRDGASFTHIHPKDLGGAILSLDHMNPKERWEWGGPHWHDHVRTDVSVAIVGAELQAEDPSRMAKRWAAVLGRSAKQSGGWRIDLDEGQIRFVPIRDGRGEGLGAFDVAVRNPSEVHRRAEALGLLDANGVVTLSGTRVGLVAS